MERVVDLSIDISERQVLQSMGAEKAALRKPSHRTQRAVTDAIQTIHELATPQGTYRVLPVHTEGSSVHLDGVATLESKRLANVLRHCDKAAVFVATLGAEVDRVIEEYSSSSMYHATILDSSASFGAESCAECLQEKIEEESIAEEKLTRRYSPGYCDWTVKDQEALFGVFSPDPVGVKLNDNFLMTPKKSVSGIIGIGRSDDVEKNGNACLHCSRADCPYRRIE